MAGPVFTVEPGMSGNVLILAFVVIVIGGIGSIRGAFLAALLVGLLDTMGRALLPDLLRLVLSASAARQTGAARIDAGIDAGLYRDGGDPVLPSRGAVSGAANMRRLLLPCIVLLELAAAPFSGDDPVVAPR
jgi:ABC-type branched-subunit amino acid transport system permease subunit